MPWRRRHLLPMRQACLQAFRVLSLLAVCGYLGLVLLHVLPENPLQAQLEPVNRQVVGDFFDQGWGMFAPGPPTTSWTLLARCHGRQGSSQWMDLTTQRMRSPRWNPLSLDLRLVGYLQDAVRKEEALRAEERKQREAPGSEDAAAMLVRRREALERRWARIGSVACVDAFGPHAFDQVELKYRRHALATWSTRHQPRPPPTEEQLGRFALLGDRVRPGLFHAEVAP